MEANKEEGWWRKFSIDFEVGRRGASSGTSITSASNVSISISSSSLDREPKDPESSALQRVSNLIHKTKD